MNKMKKIIIIATLLLCCFSVLTYAHSGGTDGSGGHYDHGTGEYHYHHGYPAHQHTNGMCPYDFDDRADHDGDYSSNSRFPKANNTNTSSGNQKSTLEKFFDVIMVLAFWYIVLPLCIHLLVKLFRPKQKNK